MKKFFALVMLLSAMTMTVQAQGGVKFGIKGGLNITKMSFDKELIESKNKTGFFVGPTVQASLPGGLGMDISALYDQRDMEVDVSVGSGYNGSVGADENKFTQKSLRFPINLRYKFGIGSQLGIYGAAGPQFAFPLGDKVFETNFGEYRLRDASLSLNLGAGVYVTKHLELGFTYNIPLGKSGEFEWKNIKESADDSKDHTWQLNAAIFF